MVNHPTNSSRRFSLITLAVAFLFGSPLLGLADDPDFPQIRAELQTWRSSFATIRVIWHEGIVNEDSPLGPEKRFDDHDYNRYEFFWADWGALKWELTAYWEREPVYRTMYGTDGRQPWDASTEDTRLIDDADVNQLAMIKLYRPVPEKPLSSTIALGGLQGLWHVKAGKWLDERLSQHNDVTLLGYQELSGVRCAVVKLVTDLVKTNPDLPYSSFLRQETFWLDDEHDYLPRKHEILTSRADENDVVEDRLFHAYTWKVVEYQRIDDGVWFPKRGTLRIGSDDALIREWEIKEVTLNPRLARSVFQPPNPSPGTNVLDYVNMKGRKVGGSEPTSKPKSKSAKDQPRADSSTVRAVPSSFPWRWTGLFAAFILAFGLGYRWWQRNRMESQ